MRTTIKRNKTNKTRLFFTLFFCTGVVIGRLAPKWLNEPVWTTVTEMIIGAMEPSKTVVKTYLTVFSAVFLTELAIFLISFSFVAFPMMLLFFLCGGIGVGTALTAYFAVFKGHGLLFGIFVLGPQMIGIFSTYILLSELVLKASRSLLASSINNKPLSFDDKTRYHLPVKIFAFTIFLAICSLYFSLMKHHFAPILPY